MVDPNKTQNLKFRVLNKLHSEINRISYELRLGNYSNDDAKAMEQYGLEGRGVAKKCSMRGWRLPVAIAVA